MYTYNQNVVYNKKSYDVKQNTVEYKEFNVSIL